MNEFNATTHGRKVFSAPLLIGEVCYAAFAVGSRIVN